jgi:Icc-related predicted phosphoesterase
MTHHAPTYLSIVPGYRDSQLNYLYCSNLEDLIFETQPDVWVHGHTHASVDYDVGKTRVVTNPRGYIGYGKGGGPENPNFNPNFIVEI